MRILLAAIATATLLLLSGFMSQAASMQFCHLSSSGLYHGQWVKHRILLRDEVVYGANDLDSVSSELQNLRQQGLCR
jgi:hypothetical protein